MEKEIKIESIEFTVKMNRETKQEENQPVWLPWQDAFGSVSNTFDTPTSLSVTPSHLERHALYNQRHALERPTPRLIIAFITPPGFSISVAGCLDAGLSCKTGLHRCSVQMILEFNNVRLEQELDR